MVNKFKNILETIEKEKGKLRLFAILKMDNLSDKWSVLISGPWIDEGNFDDAFRYIASVLNHELSDEESSEVARIGIFPKGEHIIDLFSQYSVNTILENEKVNGFYVHEAYILASDKNI